MRRLQALKTERSSWEAHWQEIARNMMPRAGRFAEGRGDRGGKKHNNIIDNTPILAARTLGAGELEIFLRISLPLAGRGVAAGLMLAFARAMGEFGATLMIAGNLPGKTQTLSIAVYDAVQAGNDAQALWLTLLISVVCMFVLVVSSRLLQAKH